MASAAPKPLELPPRLGELYRLLAGQGDVAILDLHKAYFGYDAEQTPTSKFRYAQQYLGPQITKLNRRLREHRQIVRPGQLKGTYVLASL